MQELKNFTKQGAQYTMKRQFGFGLLILAGLLLFALIGYNIGKPVMIWVFGGIALLASVAMWTKSVVVDKERKVIRVKSGLINPVAEISFSDFQNFQVEKISQLGIVTNNHLHIQYLRDGKLKTVMIAQGFTGKSVQEIVNELEEIMHGNEHS